MINKKMQKLQYIKFLNKQETSQLLNQLKQQYEISNPKAIKGIFAKQGAERILFFTGNLKEQEIINLSRAANIEKLGLYFAKEQNGGIRLSIEGSQLISKAKPAKNIFILKNQEQLESWMKGNELNINSGLNGFVLIKYKDDFLGTGKASELKITNFIPKNRRLKEKS